MNTITIFYKTDSRDDLYRFANHWSHYMKDNGYPLDSVKVRRKFILFGKFILTMKFKIV